MIGANVKHGYFVVGKNYTLGTIYYTLLVKRKSKTSRQTKKVRQMEHREAVRILMLSPFYFRITVKERLKLIKRYCREIALQPLSSPQS